MALHRDNDEERAAMVDRLVSEHRHQRPPEHRKVLTENPSASERRVQSERRRGRSDVELRKQRAALERQWNEQHRRNKRRKAS